MKRSKKDTRLFFTFEELNLDPTWIKNKLIQLGYIEHEPGDRYRVVRSWDLEEMKKKLLDINAKKLRIKTELI